MPDLRTNIRAQGRWLVRQLATETGQTEAEVEAALNELITHGHLRVLPGVGPGGLDAFEPVIGGGGNGAI